MAKRVSIARGKKNKTTATAGTEIAGVKAGITGGQESDVVTVDQVEIESILDDKIRIIQAIKVGLPYKSFEIIYQQSPFTHTFWADALGLSTKSLTRYKTTRKKFKPLQSEKIIELAEVSDIGKKAFDNDEDFELWLNTPSVALGHNKPIDLIKNSYGKELVVTELTNIDQGIFV